MRTNAILAVAWLSLLLGGPAVAEQGGFDIEELAFIAGSWQGPLFGGQADETWTAPRNGSMVGVFRLTWDDGRRLYELFIIEENDARAVEMVFRHFGEGMELWEREIEKPNRFVLVDAGEDFAVFDAPDRSQEPARFRFQRDPDSDRLTITVAALDETGNIKESFDAVYERSQP